MADADTDTIVLNQPLERRESKTGKVRYTVAVRSEPLVHDFSAKQLGKPVAAAIAQVLRDQVRAIGTVASAATLRARKTAAAAFASGKPWAMKRYAGGRTGAMAPNQSMRAFNDSGRFAASITANARDDAWTINIAANRLDESTAGASGVQKIFERLVELVPAFRDPALLLEDKRVTTAIEQGYASLITKARETGDMLTFARVRAIVSTARAALDLVAAFAA